MRETATRGSKLVELPDIPRKRYFAIGEVSDLCGVKPHVLRYWEQEFPQLKPVKRRGNRRYYQQEDVQIVRRIRSLLYEQGFTIGGARQQLRDAGRFEAANNAEFPPRRVTPSRRTREIHSIRGELEQILKLLDR
jgi:DNA-binding transcriptional MerR regulator